MKSVKRVFKLFCCITFFVTPYVEGAQAQTYIAASGSIPSVLMVEKSPKELTRDEINAVNTSAAFVKNQDTEAALVIDFVVRNNGNEKLVDHMAERMGKYTADEIKHRTFEEFASDTFKATAGSLALAGAGVTAVGSGGTLSGLAVAGGVIAAAEMSPSLGRLSGDIANTGKALYRQDQKRWGIATESESLRSMILSSDPQTQQAAMGILEMNYHIYKDMVQKNPKLKVFMDKLFFEKYGLAKYDLTSRFGTPPVLTPDAQQTHKGSNDEKVKVIHSENLRKLKTDKNLQAKLKQEFDARTAAAAQQATQEFNESRSREELIKNTKEFGLGLQAGGQLMSSLGQLIGNPDIQNAGQVASAVGTFSESMSKYLEADTLVNGLFCANAAVGVLLVAQSIQKGNQQAKIYKALFKALAQISDQLIQIQDTLNYMLTQMQEKFGEVLSNQAYQNFLELSHMQLTQFNNMKISEADLKEQFRDEQDRRRELHNAMDRCLHSTDLRALTLCHSDYANLNDLLSYPYIYRFDLNSNAKLDFPTLANMNLKPFIHILKIPKFGIKNGYFTEIVLTNNEITLLDDADALSVFAQIAEMYGMDVDGIADYRLWTEYGVNYLKILAHAERANKKIFKEYTVSPSANGSGILDRLIQQGQAIEKVFSKALLNKELYIRIIEFHEDLSFNLAKELKRAWVSVVNSFHAGQDQPKGPHHRLVDAPCATAREVKITNAYKLRLPVHVAEKLDYSHYVPESFQVAEKLGFGKISYCYDWNAFAGNVCKGELFIRGHYTSYSQAKDSKSNAEPAAAQPAPLLVMSQKITSRGAYICNILHGRDIFWGFSQYSLFQSMWNGTGPAAGANTRHERFGIDFFKLSVPNTNELSDPQLIDATRTAESQIRQSFVQLMSQHLPDSNTGLPQKSNEELQVKYGMDHGNFSIAADNIRDLFQVAQFNYDALDLATTINGAWGKDTTQCRKVAPYLSAEKTFQEAARNFHTIEIDAEKSEFKNLAEQKSYLLAISKYQAHTTRIAQHCTPKGLKEAVPIRIQRELLEKARDRVNIHLDDRGILERMSDGVSSFFDDQR